MDCLFCKIVDKQIPAAIVYEDDSCLAFNDINPQAPHHVLIVPREHIASLNELAEDHEAAAGHLLRVAARIAADRGVAEPGFRTVINTNGAAGQTVFHIHVHLLAGRDLTWPPG